MTDNGGNGARKTSPGPEQSDAKHAYSGHRERLRSRFLDAGDEALADYELLELLLFGVIPRRDVKPLAKALITRFGSFGAVLSADPLLLQTSAGLTRTQSAQVAIVAACARRMLKEEVVGRPILSNWTAVLNYLTVSMQHLETEEFRVIFLNKKLRVITDERQQKGTVDHAPVYPREIVRRALEVNASSVILVHNHPSGDLKPSSADIQMTRAVDEALRTVGIIVHDHLIIGRKAHTSLKATGLI